MPRCRLLLILHILFTISFVGIILKYLINSNEEPYHRNDGRGTQQKIGKTMGQSVFVGRETIIDKSTKTDRNSERTTPRTSFMGRNQEKIDNLVTTDGQSSRDSNETVKLFPRQATKTVRSMFTTDRVQRAKISATFNENWCRLQKARIDWKGFLSTCEQHTVWEKKRKMHGKRNPTDPRKSFIASWEISPAGEFSRFFIQSMTTTNRTKSTGGDTWRIHLRGPSSLAPTVIDLGNGKYEVIFLLLESGMYRAEIFLDYTLCDGLEDPPVDWFKKGNPQGKNQPEGTLLGNKPYLIAPFRDGERVEFFVSSTRNGNSLSGLQNTLTPGSCEGTCKSALWDGLGRWAAGQWKPYIQVSPTKRRDPRNNEGTLWLFGDSVSNGFHASLTTGPYRQLCSHVFTSCQKVYHWVYDMKGYWGDGVTSPREPVPDGKDYDHERVLKDIRKVLYHPKMDGKSILLLNMGIHYAAAVNFTNYKKLIDDVISISQIGEIDPEDGKRKKFQGRLMWKTTTALNRHRFPSPHKDVRRFLTFPRVELYNAYATSAMCRAGIDVIDVYPISNSYPEGTASLNDPVHYNAHVFRDVERLLFEMFRP